LLARRLRFYGEKMMQQALVLTILLLTVRGSESSCKLYDCLRERARVQPVDGLYYPYCCNNASMFCRILPEYSFPNPLHNLTAEMNGYEYLPVMIDLEYDAHNSLVQNNKNIVKNDTIIYCVINDSCSECGDALDPIRVVTYNIGPACQPSVSQPTVSISTALQRTVPQPTASSSLPTASQQATPSVSQTVQPVTLEKSSTDAGQLTFISVHVLGLLFDAGNIILSLVTLMFLCCNRKN
jgi:hypothetical protein